MKQQIYWLVLFTLLLLLLYYSSAWHSLSRHLLMKLHSAYSRLFHQNQLMNTSLVFHSLYVLFSPSFWQYFQSLLQNWLSMRWKQGYWVLHSILIFFISRFGWYDDLHGSYQDSDLFNFSGFIGTLQCEGRQSAFAGFEHHCWDIW